jgi:hypothetical protein
MSGINAKQFRDYLVIPTLQYLDPVIPFNQNAVELLMGTAMQESNLGGAIHQFGGPALGAWEIEVYNALWTWVKNHPAILAKMTGLAAPGLSLEQNMEGNLFFNCAMARIYYWGIPAPLPAAGDTEGQWEYYKKYYNTDAGAATRDQYMAGWAALQKMLAP